MNDINDQYDLNRFVKAQEHSYTTAFSEIKNGQKRSHWIWYIFPQIDGLGFSPTSQHYSIKSIAEAKEYLEHPLLGLRLIECVNVILNFEGRSAYKIFGHPDDRKLKSCLTLFAYISPAESIFEKSLDKYFQGEYDKKTLDIIDGSEDINVQ